MRESAVEKKLGRFAKENKGLSLKWISPGMVGVPDRIVILSGGKIGFVELKAPGCKPRQIQQAVIRKFYRLGCRVASVDNSRSAEGFIRLLAKRGGIH